MNPQTLHEERIAGPEAATDVVCQAAQRFHQMADEIESLTRVVEQLNRAARPTGRDARRVAAAMDALMSASHYLHQVGEPSR